MTEILVVLVLAMAPGVWQGDRSQNPPAPVALPAAAQEPPGLDKLAPIAPPATPLTLAERQDHRDNVSNMEGLLATAVANGARRMQAENPTVPLVASGQPRARGFVLEGYGLFFDVEIPELNGGVELTMQQLQRELTKRLEETPAASGTKRTASAQSLPSDDDRDPNEHYREVVIGQVAGMMLDYTKNLNVQPNEWMTVALRGSDMLPQMGIRDSRTIMLRIKGSDLADYLASRISKAEAMRKVEKREF